MTHSALHGYNVENSFSKAADIHQTEYIFVRRSNYTMPMIKYHI